MALPSLWAAEGVVDCSQMHKSLHSKPLLFSITPGSSSRRLHFLAVLIFNKLLASDLIMPPRAIFIFYKHK